MHFAILQESCQIGRSAYDRTLTDDKRLIKKGNICFFSSMVKFGGNS
jgi:hypothetical protein